LITYVINIPMKPQQQLVNLIIASCAAGIGGAVFMVLEYYIHVAYPRPGHKFLMREEIPRYTLLPFSSTILGAKGCLQQRPDQ
jgi:hypothetical protein